MQRFSILLDFVVFFSQFIFKMAHSRKSKSRIMPFIRHSAYSKHCAHHFVLETEVNGVFEKVVKLKYTHF